MKKKSVRSQVLLCLFFSVMCILILIPFILLVSISLSNEQAISDFGYSMWPRQLDLKAYRYVFQDPAVIFRAYGVTGLFSVLSMFFSVALMAMIAYPLSRKTMKGRQGLSFYLYFTMLFSGGMVSSYILNTQYLHLQNTLWIYILPGLISPWYVFMIRTFFQNIPGEIIESAYIDGASEYRIFLNIIAPLSKPVFATIALFVFLNSWNNWTTPILYIDDPKLYSLQFLLQKIMADIKLLASDPTSMLMQEALQDLPGESIRMAMAVVVAGPALVVFPFFQKYFVKGITVGSIKG